MTANELLYLIEDLEADGYEDLTREDMHWLAGYDDPEQARREWYADRCDWREEIPTAADLNEGRADR